MEDIIEAAKSENWKLVDQRITEVCNNIEVQKRAIKLLNDSDGNVRDLGASILGKANIPLKRFSNIRPILKRIMDKDSNQYARYRAAFALAEHGAGDYKNDVLGVLNEASQDKDVGEIAKTYLKKLGK